MQNELTVEQMRELDRLLETDYEIDILQTMEIAGLNIAKFTIEYFKPKSVCILLGKGYNGGDGLVAARHLHNRGIKVIIILADKNLRDISQHQLNIVRNMKIETSDEIDKSADLFMDCLLGYSAVGSPHGKIGELIKKFNTQNSTPKILSIDIPSGFNVTNNIWYESSFKDSVCLTLGVPKLNMINNPHIKKLFIGDIGIPLELYEKFGIKNIFKDGKSVVEIS